MRNKFLGMVAGLAGAITSQTMAQPVGLDDSNASPSVMQSDSPKNVFKSDGDLHIAVSNGMHLAFYDGKYGIITKFNPAALEEIAKQTAEAGFGNSNPDGVPFLVIGEDQANGLLKLMADNALAGDSVRYYSGALDKDDIERGVGGNYYFNAVWDIQADDSTPVAFNSVGEAQAQYLAQQKLAEQARLAAANENTTEQDTGNQPINGRITTLAATDMPELYAGLMNADQTNNGTTSQGPVNGTVVTEENGATVTTEDGTAVTHDTNTVSLPMTINVVDGAENTESVNNTVPAETAPVVKSVSGADFEGKIYVLKSDPSVAYVVTDSEQYPVGVIPGFKLEALQEISKQTNDISFWSLNVNTDTIPLTYAEGDAAVTMLQQVQSLIKAGDVLEVATFDAEYIEREGSNTVLISADNIKAAGFSAARSETSALAELVEDQLDDLAKAPASAPSNVATVTDAAVTEPFSPIQPDPASQLAPTEGMVVSGPVVVDETNSAASAPVDPAVTASSAEPTANNTPAAEPAATAAAASDAAPTVNTDAVLLQLGQAFSNNDSGYALTYNAEGNIYVLTTDGPVYKLATTVQLEDLSLSTFEVIEVTEVTGEEQVRVIQSAQAEINTTIGILQTYNSNDVAGNYQLGLVEVMAMTGDVLVLTQAQDLRGNVDVLRSVANNMKTGADCLVPETAVVVPQAVAPSVAVNSDLPNGWSVFAESSEQDPMLYIFDNNTGPISHLRPTAKTATTAAIDTAAPVTALPDPDAPAMKTVVPAGTNPALATSNPDAPAMKTVVPEGINPALTGSNPDAPDTSVPAGSIDPILAGLVDGVVNKTGGYGVVYNYDDISYFIDSNGAVYRFAVPAQPAAVPGVVRYFSDFEAMGGKKLTVDVTEVTGDEKTQVINETKLAIGMYNSSLQTPGSDNSGLVNKAIGLAQVSIADGKMQVTEAELVKTNMPYSADVVGKLNTAVVGSSSSPASSSPAVVKTADETAKNSAPAKGGDDAAAAGTGKDAVPTTVEKPRSWLEWTLAGVAAALGLGWLTSIRKNSKAKQKALSDADVIKQLKQQQALMGKALIALIEQSNAIANKLNALAPAGQQVAQIDANEFLKGFELMLNTDGQVVAKPEGQTVAANTSPSAPAKSAPRGHVTTPALGLVAGAVTAAAAVTGLVTSREAAASSVAPVAAQVDTQVTGPEPKVVGQAQPAAARKVSIDFGTGVYQQAVLEDANASTTNDTGSPYGTFITGPMFQGLMRVR